MRGNSHVRFLGEGVAAMRPPYPTPCNKPPAVVGGLGKSRRWMCISLAMPVVRKSLVWN